MEVESFYQQRKSEKQILIPDEFAELIDQEAPLTFEGALSSLHEDAKVKRIRFLLTLFVVRRPDLGFRQGMNSILGVAMSVFSREVHAFSLFCHLVENVYPQVPFT